MFSVQIREATVGELGAVAELAEEFYASTRFLKVFDTSRFIRLWTGFIEAGTGVIFAIFDGDMVGGAIAGMLYPEPNSGDLIAQEFFWFIRKSYRGGIGSIRLYRLLEQWAVGKQCVTLHMGHLTDSMPEKVSAFYRRMGFQMAEVVYVKDLKESEAKCA